MKEPGRIVAGHIPLSLDGRVSGPGGLVMVPGRGAPASSGALCLRYDLIRPAAGR